MGYVGFIDLSHDDHCMGYVGFIDLSHDDH
jgi:hypothetical protein